MYKHPSFLAQLVGDHRRALLAAAVRARLAKTGSRLSINESRPRRFSTRRRLAVAGSAALLAAAACGGDDNKATATSESSAEGADVGAYCDAVLAIELAPFPDLDFETASPEEVAAARQGYYDALRPLADDAVDAAPAEIADDLAVLSAALDELPTSEEDPFEEPDVSAAESRVHTFDLGNCGWGRQEVTATEYAFDGLAAELAAGATSFEFTNDGAELHQLLLARVNDGVSESAEEIVHLPEEEAFALISLVPGDAFAAPGDDAYLVADLEEGRYIAACFIPVGTTGDGPPPDGPPHALHGMFAEFRVK